MTGTDVDDASQGGDAEQPDMPGELILYQTEDGEARIHIRLIGGAVWLSQRLLADLYQVSVKTINEHLGNIYADNELDPVPTIRKFRIVQMEGKREVIEQLRQLEKTKKIAMEKSNESPAIPTPPLPTTEPAHTTKRKLGHSRHRCRRSDGKRSTQC